VLDSNFVLDDKEEIIFYDNLTIIIQGKCAKLYTNDKVNIAPTIQKITFPYICHSYDLP
jgi:hypothetical protein